MLVLVAFEAGLMRSADACNVTFFSACIGLEVNDLHDRFGIEPVFPVYDNSTFDHICTYVYAWLTLCYLTLWLPVFEGMYFCSCSSSQSIIRLVRVDIMFLLTTL